MRMLTLVKRNTKEILRDPLNYVFGLGFPLVMIVLLTVIQSNVPVALFRLDSLTPGITAFGMSFMALFSATVISKDRCSGFMHRLSTSRITALDYILSYTLPIIPIAIVQCAICYGVAAILGLEITINVLYAMIFLLPVAVFYIALGLLFGSILNDEQVAGVCGALLTNLSAWLAGIWFDLNLASETLRKVAYALPFVHAVELERAALAGDFAGIFPHLWWILGYTGAAIVASMAVFLWKAKDR